MNAQTKHPISISFLLIVSVSVVVFGQTAVAVNEVGLLAAESPLSETTHSVAAASFSATNAKSGLFPTPPMGVDLWYGNPALRNEAAVKHYADIMSAKGGVALGYKLIQINDTWQGPRVDGHLTCNTNFPSGIASLASYLHSKGCLLGIYTEPWTKTSAGNVGSAGYLEQDAADFAAWGVDVVQFDVPQSAGCDNSCHLSWVDKFRAALADASPNRPIAVYSSGYRSWMNGFDPLRIANASDAWRVVTDYIFIINGNELIANHLGAVWTNTVDWFESSAAVNYANGPHQWLSMDWCPANLADVNGGTNMSKNAAALWALLPSAVMLPSYPESWEWGGVVTNKEWIDINQDAAGISARQVSSDSVRAVWWRPLANGDRAVGLINRSTNSTILVSVGWPDIGVPNSTKLVVRDVMNRANLATNEFSYSEALPPMSCRLVRVCAAQNQSPRLEARLAKGQVQLLWFGGLLQSGDQVAGSYSDVAGAISPYTVTPSAGMKFYRLRP